MKEDGCRKTAKQFAGLAKVDLVLSLLKRFKNHLRIVATLSTYRISKYMLQYAMTCLEPTAIIGRTTKTSVMIVGLKKIVKNHAACVPMVSKMSCFMMLIFLIFNLMLV